MHWHEYDLFLVLVINFYSLTTSVVTKTLDVETEAKAKAVYLETEAQGTRQLVYIFF